MAPVAFSLHQIQLIADPEAPIDTSITGVPGGALDPMTTLLKRFKDKFLKNIRVNLPQVRKPSWYAVDFTKLCNDSACSALSSSVASLAPAEQPKK